MTSRADRSGSSTEPARRRACGSCAATSSTPPPSRARSPARIRCFISPRAPTSASGRSTTPEDAPFPVQTSLYGAAKLAGEGLIQAFCEGFGFQGWIFRFVSILGPRYSHGHVFDFYRSLRKDPTRLHVLGNGKQRKSYLHVDDCVDAILLALERAQERVNVLNLGTDEHCEVDDSVRWITEALGISPERTYSGGKRGWIGDNPLILLDCTRMRALGWRPKHGIREGIVETLRYLQESPWLLEARS